MSATCSKCGGEVHPADDARLVEAAFHGGDAGKLLTYAAQGKHLGECSPSVSQYIRHPQFNGGEPFHDDRPEFDRRLKSHDDQAVCMEFERGMTMAWVDLQVVHGRM